MGGIVIDGEQVEVPGFESKSWLDDPELRRSGEDGRKRRTRWVRSIIVHTTKGIPGGRNKTAQKLLKGGKDQGKELAVARFWSRSKLSSGAHLIIDTDGSIGCIADLRTEAMFHATQLNDNSIGIEIYQEADAGIYEQSLASCVALIEVLCRAFGIQRQFHAPYRGPFSRMMKPNNGDDCVGVFGHRDLTNNRGSGDPGDFIFEHLEGAGFERFNFDDDEDKDIWKERQELLGLRPDGIPGPQTVNALKEAGYRNGLWTLGKAELEVEDPLDVKSYLCKCLGC